MARRARAPSTTSREISANGGAPRPEWEADIAIDIDRAKHAVASQFPEFAASPVEPYGAGWDNAAYLVDRRVVFRFPRRRIAVALIERELELLPLLAPHLPLPIPAPRFAGRPTHEYPAPFAGYPHIPGTCDWAQLISNAERAALAEPLARFLRALHGVDPGPFVERGIPPDTIGRLDHEKRLKVTLERLPRLRDAGYGAGGDAAAAWLEAHPPLPAPRPCLVHGDLYERHVLLDAELRVAGIIDWGDFHLGDPGIDLAIVPMVLPPEAHPAFRAAYGSIDERTWNVAFYRATYHAILQLDYGIREGDAGMRESGAAALGLIFGRPPSEGPAS